MNKNLYILLCPVFLLLFSLKGYAQPVFTAGHSQTLSVCENSSTLVINVLLSVSDAHTGTTDTWSVVSSPTHGTLVASYFTTSTGGTLTPTGTNYGPAAGYAGPDSFKVKVTDGTTSDTTTVYVTVKPLPNAGTISGPSSVCSGSSVSFTAGVPGGAWSTTNGSATVSSGLVTGVSAGLDTIVFSVTNTCGTATTSATITVNAVPGPITGSTGLCSGIPSQFSDTVAGGTWTASPGTVVAIGSTSGIATGSATGAAMITYTLSGGCATTFTATVHPMPAAITGPSSVCQGAQIVLLSGSGLWTSSNATVASVVPSIGLVTGVNSGTATITFTKFGCSVTKNILVNPTSPIVGPPAVCTGLPTIFSDTLTGGTWSTASTTTIIVGSGSGMVTGLTIGTASVTYTLSTGCAVTKTETVNPSPVSITGSADVCVGLTAALSDVTSGGLWSSENTAVATVGSSTGVVSGLVLGSADIFYTIPATGCYAVKTVSVDPLPVVFTVTGGGAYCMGGPGARVYLSGSETGVNYALYLGTSVAGTEIGTGSTLDFGPMPLVGIYTAKATNTATGCISYMASSATVSITATVTPTAHILASTGDTLCEGAITTFTADTTYAGTTPFFKWLVDDTLVAIATSYSYGPTNGDVVTVMLVSNVTCAIPDTIYDSVKLTVVPHQVPAVTAAHADTICQTTTVILNPVPLYGGTAPTYTYFDKGFVVGSGPVYKYHPVNGDTLTVVMVSNYFCRTTDTAIDKIYIVVDTPVIPNLVLTNSPTVLTGENVSDTVLATVTNTSQPLIYQWLVDTSVVTGSVSDTLISILFHYTKVDSVTCYVTTTGACKMTTYSWIFIENNIGVKPLVAATGYMSVIPNPNKGEFILKGSLGNTADEHVSLQISDMTGHVVYENTVPAREGIIDEKVLLNGNFPNGMYLLSVRSETVSKVFHLVVEQ